MTLERLLSAWRREPTVAGNVADWRILAAQEPRYAPLPSKLHPDLAAALRSLSIQSLYTHQAEAWEGVQAGEDVVIVTGTASGKTLGYNLPVLDRLLRDPSASALYLFPTKALAQDQLSALHGLLAALPNGGEQEPVPAAIYDGDTPKSARQAIRQRTRLLLTNPDMLHLGILPHHTRWMSFLKDLRYVVVDEMHIYRGVFGSHVANVLRRLKRLARFYGAHPQYILTSATIANPGEHARRLVEADCRVIDRDGSGRGPRHFLIYNPPLVDRDLGLRRSAMQESVRLAEDLLAYEVQSILFARSRRTVEIILAYLREGTSSFPTPPSASKPANPGNPSESAIRGYRSGYLPGERRLIERGLRQGQVRIVVATNALELGIDIGALDAALLVGYPGSIAATAQQAGRAGRGTSASLAVLVATADPLDQFLAAHPDYLSERRPESALINPDNPLILLDHLKCAAFELPFQDGDRFEGLADADLAEFLEVLEAQHVLHRSGSKFFWMADQYPAQAISLRSAAAEPVLLQSLDPYGDPLTIGQVDRASAVWMVHPQAVYLHEGRIYQVEELDLEGHIAHLSPAELDYYTLPRTETTVELVKQGTLESAPGGIKAHGEVLVTSQVKGFRKVRWHTHEVLGFGELDLPPTELLTTGYWLALDESTVEGLREAGVWRSDTNRYGPNWRRQRDLARARDGYRCRVCGAPEVSHAHDVHHLTPFRLFTSYEQANRLENLLTVCPDCHRRVEAAVKVRTGLAGMAYALHHMAPLFLMCDSGDLGAHSDPQLSLAGGQPGVVLFEHTPAGIGFSQRLFELHAELLGEALELVGACPCADGCPSCVGPSGPGVMVGGDADALGGKEETMAILRALV